MTFRNIVPAISVVCSSAGFYRTLCHISLRVQSPKSLAVFIQSSLPPFSCTKSAGGVKDMFTAGGSRRASQIIRFIYLAPDPALTVQ